MSPENKKSSTEPLSRLRVCSVARNVRSPTSITNTRLDNIARAALMTQLRAFDDEDDEELDDEEGDERASHSVAWWINAAPIDPTHTHPPRSRFAHR